MSSSVLDLQENVNITFKTNDHEHWKKQQAILRSEIAPALEVVERGLSDVIDISYIDFTKYA